MLPVPILEAGRLVRGDASGPGLRKTCMIGPQNLPSVGVAQKRGLRPFADTD